MEHAVSTLRTPQPFRLGTALRAWRLRSGSQVLLMGLAVASSHYSNRMAACTSGILAVRRRPAKASDNILGRSVGNAGGILTLTQRERNPKNPVYQFSVVWLRTQRIARSTSSSSKATSTTSTARSASSRSCSSVIISPRRPDSDWGSSCIQRWLNCGYAQNDLGPTRHRGVFAPSTFLYPHYHLKALNRLNVFSRGGQGPPTRPHRQMRRSGFFPSFGLGNPLIRARSGQADAAFHAQR